MPRLDVIGMLSLTLCCYAAPPSDQAQCGKPPKIENALLQGDWDVENFPPGSTAAYSCHPGYSPLGRIRRACVEGKWQVLSKGLCRKKSCGHPGEISFGTFELKNGYEFVFGAEVEYSCDEGYQMISRHNTRICAADGWTNFLPHCEARLCPPVMDDSVRVITSVADDEFSMGHVINLKCKNPKHTLSGPSQIYCTEHGTWNVDPPTCKESCIIQETDMGKNNIHLKNNRGLHVKDNEDVHFQCNYGYNILDPANLTIQCNSGVLEYPTCQKIEKKTCGRPPHLQNGQITESVNDTYDSGSLVTYKCQQFFKAHGQTVIQCQDGIWDEPPVCLAMKPCGRPPQILYGHITEPVNNTYDSGSSVTYKCQPYFAVYGQEMIQCQDGKWGKPPVCLDEAFTFPRRRINFSSFSASAPLGQGGSVRGIHSHEETANKSLDQQKQVPQKTEKRPCGRPPQIQHGDVSTAVNDSYKSGLFVTYKCQKYFTIQGRKKIQCQDGIWDESPVCLAKKPCGRPPQILNGEVTATIKDTYDTGSSVTYKCQKYFIVNGHKMIKCQDGNWGEPPVCLEPCTTSETHMHENHITLIWKNGNSNHCIRSDENENYAKKCYVKHNQIIKFACLPGYMIYNKMELISMCNKGTLSYPRCLKVN
ncbi:complement factor H-related protein 5-like isoform X1 [Ranitomeya imitator]|uniref:complement factor H-related protein 5-like isoform X1 n=1 Tax=Ranitomeya imitator TaxID=111125 RepID=UPI0037E7C5C2